MSRNPVLAALTVLTLAIALGQGEARAQVKPFKITGEGVAPFGLPLPGQPARPHTIVGNATYLGRHTGKGSVSTDPNNLVFHADGRITGEFGSGDPFEFTGANGDVLTCIYGRLEGGASEPGTFELVPVDLSTGLYKAYFIAEFVPFTERCTGKFAGVTGGWVMYAVSDPFHINTMEPLSYSWEGTGSLNFRRGK